jgi:hypothetical protein
MRFVAVAGDHLGDAAAVVEADEGLGHDQPALGEAAPLVRQRHRGLELRHVVVREVADDRSASSSASAKVTSREPAPIHE